MLSASATTRKAGRSWAPKRPDRAADITIALLSRSGSKPVYLWLCCEDRGEDGGRKRTSTRVSRVGLGPES